MGDTIFLRSNFWFYLALQFRSYALIAYLHITAYAVVYLVDNFHFVAPIVQLIMQYLIQKLAYSFNHTQSIFFKFKFLKT